jgi:outer membrane protein OmpA-like peptidoglycan-associated protein
MPVTSFSIRATAPTQAVREMDRTRTIASVQMLPAAGYSGNQSALRKFSRIAPRVQYKMQIGAANDPLEAEADRVADRVMRMPDQITSAVLRRKCAACDEEDNKTKLQAKRADSQQPADAAPDIVNEVLSQPGQALPEQTRAFFEPRFGRDFSGVRVHSDARAAESARSVGALGYTVGRNIVFAEERFMPGTDPGRRLIAHELAHVVQQGGGSESLRRLGDLSKVPRVLPCPVAPSTAPPATDFVLFPNGGTTLTVSHKAQIGAFVDNWNTSSKGATVRVDGFASEPGGDALNWQLSCNRALTAKEELMNPSAAASPGIPEASINLFMQGETAEFGDEAQNRRATLSLAATPAGQQPAPQPPDQADQQPKPDAKTEPAAPAVDEPTLPTNSCGHNPDCPDDYCKPFRTRKEALADRGAKAAGILIDIARANGRATELFRKFIFNPGPAGNISAQFATDFTNSPTTFEATRTLQKMLEDFFNASPPTFPAGGSTVTVNINALSQKTIDDTLNKQMVFDDPFSVPGLIAGGIGLTQVSCQVGANTQGAQDDARSATGTATVTRNPDGTLLVQPEITFTVVDTLDFCPGNCGGFVARILTVPLSRWEASSISGDVPFIVRFPAPSIVGSAGSED